MYEADRELLEGIERRKDAKDDPCDSCRGTGGDGNSVCIDCLGQGILLTREEYYGLMRIAGYDPEDFDGDGILEAEIIEAE